MRLRFIPKMGIVRSISPSSIAALEDVRTAPIAASEGGTTA